MNFVKMHGLGNDFIIFDGRLEVINLTKELIIALASRHKGVGCDQIAVIGKSKNSHAKLEFWNADGSKSATCGNATRCIGDILFKETTSDFLILETVERKIECKRDGIETCVNMGNPLFAWHEIPLSREMDTLALDLEGKPTATSMGNPHCTFFVSDLTAINIEKIGKSLENNQLFPKGTNVQFARVENRGRVKAKIWERGSGLTLSSGSSACAIVAAGVRRGILNKKVEIDCDGGKLDVIWANDGIWIKGQTSEVFRGSISDKFLEEYK